ncbi:hypothetical protein [Wenxinia marina]|uniref:Uncharacterized protein n=1 Tax=Wenxinia marina DSM 24838 TaxID=1123501 RepID=A0A0D0Q5V3_9RHOB|nr:hypothetical protein [Wenxinia marina]KIQ67872.1 hypothetical protein Wenmar_03602 [Wenxinia marina DSM 24838]GGL74420.1 hypothetical protein GCM10011392_31250 [Wenxinia marina]
MRRSVAALFLSLAPLSALAQTGLDLISSETAAFDSMVLWNERDVRPIGLTEVARVEGQIFFGVSLILDVPWSDDLQRVSINSSDIKLTLPDGTELQAIGAYDYLGMMELGSPGLSVSRPYNWPESDADARWQGVFLVPEGTSGGTLTFPGEPGWSGEVTVPAVGREVDAASFAAFTIADVDRYRRIALEDRRAGLDIGSVLTPLPGHVLADVEIEIAPTASNRTANEERFHWSTSFFRLVAADGTTYWPAGERFMDRLLDDQFNGVDPGESATRRVVWMVPEAADVAFLFYGDTMVAQVDLTGAVADEG